jgi:hypothetical protein
VKKIVAVHPHPVRFQYEPINHHVMAIEKWDDEYRMLADPKLIVDFSTEVKSLRKELLSERQYRQYMYISAEVVIKLETTILHYVFGEQQCKEKRINMQHILSPPVEFKQSVTDRWSFYEPSILQRFDTTKSFCDFLVRLKKDRHNASHKDHQLPLSVQQLEPIVLRYGQDSEKRGLQVVGELDLLPAEVKKGKKKRLMREWQDREKKTKALMELVEQIVGPYPFGQPNDDDV